MTTKIAFGAEEGAGFNIHSHAPEKDGRIADLLIAEMVVVQGSVSANSSKNYLPSLVPFID